MSTLKVTNLQHGSATAPAISVAVGGGATVLGITTFHNNVDLLDNDRLRLGAGQDLQIYHNSSNHNSYLQESGSGQLIVQTNAFRLLNAAGSENMIDADEDGAAKLYHNGSTRFETQSGGAKVGGSDGVALTIDCPNDYSNSASFMMSQGRGEIKTTIDASGGNPGGSMVLRTRNTSGSLVDSLTIDNAQQITTNSIAGSHPLRVSNGGVERFRIHSSGSVGIGTVTPTGLLEVSSNDGLTVSNTTRNGSNGVQWRLIPHNGSGSATNLRLFEGVGSTEVLNITKSGGYILVNTTTSRIVEDSSGNGPQGKIQIEGLNSDAMLSIIAAKQADTFRCGCISLGSHRGDVGGTPTILQNGDTVGALLFAAGDGTDMRIKSAQILSKVDGAPSADDVPGRLVFSTRESGGSMLERLHITQNGFVGVNETAPGAQLTVKRANTATSGLNGVLKLKQGSATNGNRASMLFSSLDDFDVAAVNGTILTHSGTVSNNEGRLEFWTKPSGGDIAERVRIIPSGYVQIGSGWLSATDYHRINGIDNTQGDAIFVVSGYQSSGGSNQDTAVFYSVNNNGSASGTGTAMKIFRDTVSFRSINAAGTLNASGADYAEYMTKAGDFTLAKGDVCGVNSEGKLTNVFADAVSFVVKSTDPSYVGGDKWHEVAGVEPGGYDDTRTEEEIAAAKVVYKEALESARQHVDRIAFSGQVPVNVTGTTPGQYIIPTAASDGSIEGTAKAEADLTMAEYMSSVGKVIAIEDDGRARIIVKVC